MLSGPPHLRKENRMLRKFARGMKIRLRKHVSLFRAVACEFGIITEIRSPYSPRPLVIAQLEDGLIVALHVEDFVVIKAA
jgi:hypothetical protein